MELLLEIARETWATLAEMAPYLLFGFLVAGVLSVCISPRVVERHLGGRGLWPVLKAALFGIPLPLCSCGVIPVGASLRQHGASRGATTSFLIATPQTGVDSILVTYSLLGPLFAVLRPLAALLSGLLGGALVSATEADDRHGPDSVTTDAGADDPRPALVRIFHYGFVVLPQDLARALLLGLLLAGVIGAVVPDDLFGEQLGSGIGAMLVMMGVGIPLYVCATGSVPIGAVLLLKGISPGAVLVFLMTGPATNAATISTIWKVLGRRAAILYLTTVAVSALLAGLALDGLVAQVGPAVGHAGHSMLPTWLDQASGLVLVGLLLFAMFSRNLSGQPRTETLPMSDTIRLEISGMNCNHCVNSVTRALSEMAGVDSVDVDLAAGSARVSGENLDQRALCAAVDALGFEAAPAKSPSDPEA